MRPDVVASGTTEARAIDHLRDALADLQTRSRVIDIDLPLPNFAQGNPWLRFGGMWADDPDWELFQGAIVAASREIDVQAQST